MSRIIKMSTHPEWFVDRQGAAKGRVVIESMISRLPPQERLVLDFSDIHVITSSFADELFGKLVQQHGFDWVRSRTTLRNVEPFVATVIKSAIYNRNPDQLIPS